MLGAVAAMVATAPVAAYQENYLAGRTFDVQVLMADGQGAFRDCMHFDEGGKFLLQASGGMSLGWALEPRDPRLAAFLAMTFADSEPPNPFALSVHGVLSGRDHVEGDMLNEHGMTFSFAGNENPSCDLGPRRAEFGGPYATMPVSRIRFAPHAHSVADRSFEMHIIDGSGAPLAICLYFGLVGNMVVDGSHEAVWRMDDLNERIPTFHSIGAGNAEHHALHGRLMPGRELRGYSLRGPSSSPTVGIGFGHEVAGCPN